MTAAINALEQGGFDFKMAVDKDHILYYRAFNWYYH
jgi:hypothetical protein